MKKQFISGFEGISLTDKFGIYCAGAAIHNSQLQIINCGISFGNA